MKHYDYGLSFSSIKKLDIPLSSPRKKRLLRARWKPQPNDVSWNLCNKEGSAGEALVITVEDGKCTPVGDVVPVAPPLLYPPGTGSEVMCDTCAEYSSQVNGSKNAFVGLLGGFGCLCEECFCFFWYSQAMLDKETDRLYTVLCRFDVFALSGFWGVLGRVPIMSYVEQWYRSWGYELN